jgi:hypothetical protein
MALEGNGDQLATTTTRRSVVTVGAKLAYAAPLVAATMKLSGLATSAQDVVSGGMACGAEAEVTFSITCVNPFSNNGCLDATGATARGSVVVCTVSGAIYATFTAASDHCSSILVEFIIAGVPLRQGLMGPLAPGQSVGPVLLDPIKGPLAPGTYTISAIAAGVVGGCNTGVLVDWGGTLHVDPN